MSSTQEQSDYSYTYSWDDPASGSGSFISFSVTAATDFDDAEAFALYNAIAAALPSTWQVSASVTKQNTTEVAFTTNLAAVPPSFT